jgi:ketosteroid isomerase-like protein
MNKERGHRRLGHDLARASALICCLLVAGCGTQPAESAAPAAQAVRSEKMSSTQEVLKRHQDTFGKSDLEGVLADYAPDAVMFTPNGPVKGAAALRPVFQQLFAEWGKPGTKFELKQETVDGHHAYMFWNAETADNIYEAGQDAFVVLNGKIVAHFFSAKITPKATKKP